VARLFCSLAKFENYISSLAEILKRVSYDKVTTSAKQKKWSFYALIDNF
jgi:hypothetical protein